MDLQGLEEGTVWAKELGVRIAQETTVPELAKAIKARC
jgi:hypothetical protein